MPGICCVFERPEAAGTSMCTTYSIQCVGVFVFFVRCFCERWREIVSSIIICTPSSSVINILCVRTRARYMYASSRKYEANTAANGWDSIQLLCIIIYYYHLWCSEHMKCLQRNKEKQSNDFTLVITFTKTTTTTESSRKIIINKCAPEEFHFVICSTGVRQCLATEGDKQNEVK